MARTPALHEVAPIFNLQGNPDIVTRQYHVNLITPMAGGGTDSWVPDLKQPVRAQSIKGQLRFWWRTTQNAINPDELRTRERTLWGGAGSGGNDDGQASSVEILVRLTDTEKTQATTIDYQQGTGDLPDYVLFPLLDKTHSKLLINVKFTLELQIPAANQLEVENSVNLWILFGGLGARVSRGCGSLYCQKVMDSFQTSDEIVGFLNQLQNASQQGGDEEFPAFGGSPYPTILNSRLAVSKPITTNFPQSIWCNLLSSYGDFRQKPGVGRNPGNGNRPGRTRWPEADAIRRIIPRSYIDHAPVHIAGNWFPRGAFGLPIQIEFRNNREDPPGKFFLQPEGKERWPSPVILKIIQINDQTCFKICLILNHVVPPDIELLSDTYNPHTLASNEHPMAYTGKQMPPEAEMLKSNESPYDALFRHLKFEEVL